MRIFANANFPFLSWRRRAYMVSALLLVVGIGAMVVNHFTTRTGAWLNYGIDFTGGTIVQVDFRQPTTVEQIRGATTQSGASGWEITRFGAENEFLIRMPTFEGDAAWDPTQQVNEALTTQFAPEAFNVVRTEAVGPKIGGELQQRALIAILISFLATLIYIAFRFEWRFGVAAVIATAHDILVALGFLALFRTEINVGTIAAFLTIVGYSLNDTIVIFDRIRENLGKPMRGITFTEVLDRSVNETLPRTVLTSGTTLLTLFALFLFGGPVIQPFALVLILGIAIGTYSSIFVATPALYAITQRWPRQEKKVRRGVPATRDRVRTAV